MNDEKFEKFVEEATNTLQLLWSEYGKQLDADEVSDLKDEVEWFFEDKK